MGKKFPFFPWQQQGGNSKIHVQISATDLFKIKKSEESFIICSMQEEWNTASGFYWHQKDAG